MPVLKIHPVFLSSGGNLIPLFGSYMHGDGSVVLIRFVDIPVWGV